MKAATGYGIGGVAPAGAVRSGLAVIVNAALVRLTGGQVSDGVAVDP